MISIVLPGRNDGYGYNSHKRIAISLNCYAAHLTDESDEILFVDYNSPNNLPTLPEAIADTLTDEARARLRIMRVRPAALEGVQPLDDRGIKFAIAYNIGFRRSNPANRWLLASTTDHIVAPHNPQISVADVLKNLPDGFYALSRYEVPQLLWEALDRTKPDTIMAALRSAAENLHLRETVRDKPPVGLENCGDFQLMLREDLFAISGLDERMVIGWQPTDANLQVRLVMLRGLGSALDGLLDLYHCAHNRWVAGAGRRDVMEHDWDFFVTSVTSPYLPFQAASWGLAGVSIEEIRLEHDPAQKIVTHLAAAIGEKQQVPLNVTRPGSFDSATVPVTHVLPYLADQIASFNIGAVMGYLGANRDMVAALARLMREWQRKPLLVAEAPFAELPEITVDSIIRTSVSEMEAAAAIVVDFSVSIGDAGASGDLVPLADCGTAARKALAAVHHGWKELVEVERSRATDGRRRRPIIVVNALNTSVEPLINRTLSDGPAPFSTRIRAGLVAGIKDNHRPTAVEMFDYLAGAIGRRVMPDEGWAGLTALMLLRNGMPAEAVPARMLGSVLTALLDWPAVQRVLLLDSATVVELQARLAAGGTRYGEIVIGENFIAQQSLVDGAERRGNIIHFPRTMPIGIALFGPYVRLPPGEYTVSAVVETEDAPAASDGIRLDVASNHGEQVIAEGEIYGADLQRGRGAGRIEVGFEVPNELAEFALEFRLWRMAHLSLNVSSIVLESGRSSQDLGAPRHVPLPRFHSADGRLTEDGWIIDLARGNRFVIGGPYALIEPGEYEAVFDFECDRTEGRQAELRLYVTDNADRQLVIQPIREFSPIDHSVKTVRFRVDKSGTKIEFRMEVFRFSRGILRFSGLTYRRI